MKKLDHKHFDFEIDKLTNSIENVQTGEVFNTVVVKLEPKEQKLLVKAQWLFDWRKELKDNSKSVYKLTTENNPKIIQGLLSIEDKTDHIFMHLVESANFNRGKNKVYLGVPGNLIAYACKISFDKGYDGFVAFDSKSALINHYIERLGATQLSGKRMYIETTAAIKLVSKYFKS